MRFRQLKISGVWIIEPEPHADERGILRRDFCFREFAEHGLANQVAQGNVSENLHQYTLRGFHYQDPPYQEAKTVSCLRGSMYAIAAYIRPESPTYLQWVAETLCAENRRSLHISPGCAMAMITLEDNTLLHYYMSEAFAPESYHGIRSDDPAFGFVWPAEPRFISGKDKSYPDFQPVRR